MNEYEATIAMLRLELDKVAAEIRTYSHMCVSCGAVRSGAAEARDIMLRKINGVRLDLNKLEAQLDNAVEEEVEDALGKHAAGRR